MFPNPKTQHNKVHPSGTPRPHLWQMRKAAPAIRLAGVSRELESKRLGYPDKRLLSTKGCLPLCSDQIDFFRDQPSNNTWTSQGFTSNLERCRLCKERPLLPGVAGAVK